MTLLFYLQSTSGSTTESRNSAADGSSKSANDNRGENRPPKSSRDSPAPSSDEGPSSAPPKDANSKEGESSPDQRKRKYDDLSDSSLIIDEDAGRDTENDEASSHSDPVFEPPKQNEVPQGQTRDESSPPPAKMPRVIPKTPKAYSNEQEKINTKTANAQTPKKSAMNKRHSSASGNNSVGRPKSIITDKANPSPKSVSNETVGKAISTANQSTKNSPVPSGSAKTNSQAHKSANTTPTATKNNPSSKSLINGTVPTAVGKTNPSLKSNSSSSTPISKRSGSTDGSCNSSDQENNGAELGGKPDAPLTPSRQGLLQPQNNNLFAAVKPNPVVDQVMITDVTSNLVTVTVLECWTSHGFFRDRGDSVTELNR